MMIIDWGDKTKSKTRITCGNCKCDFTFECKEIYIGKDIRYKKLVKYIFCPNCLNQVIIDDNVKYTPYIVTET